MRAVRSLADYAHNHVVPGLALTWWMFRHLVGLMRKETELPLEPFIGAVGDGAKLFGASSDPAAG